MLNKSLYLDPALSVTQIAIINSMGFSHFAEVGLGFNLTSGAAFKINKTLNFLSELFVTALHLLRVGLANSDTKMFCIQ